MKITLNIIDSQFGKFFKQRDMGTLLVLRLNRLNQ